MINLSFQKNIFLIFIFLPRHHKIYHLILNSRHILIKYLKWSNLHELYHGHVT